jgi:glycosyltransferase involved in cell wall biosynthesis
VRVAYVCADPGVPVYGTKGSSVHVQSVVRALLRRGAEVELLAARTGGPAPTALRGVPVHSLPRPANEDPALRERQAVAAGAELERALAALDPVDLVYERCSLWSIAALRHGRAAGVPTVLEVNAPLVDEQARHRVLIDRARAERIACEQAELADVLVAVSPGVAAHLRRRHPAAAGRVRVIGNGIDPARFPAALLRERDAAARPFTVGFLGTLKPWHALDALVDAFAVLCQHVPDARLLVVGDGPGRTGLEEHLAAIGVAGAAKLTGAVMPDAVPALLARMDVAVAPYPPLPDFYFSPLKVLEAMAAGLPVVASRIGDLDRLVADGRTGRLVTAGDPAALAGALRALAEHPDERARLGAAARRTVLSAHTWDTVVGRIISACGFDAEVA